MKHALSAVWRALRLWWREPMLFILLNILWLVMQIPLITAPAATAALYAVARKSAHDEYLSPADFLTEMRRLFVPALKWGLLNLLILGAVAGNLYAYSGAPGVAWIFLRGLWIGIGIVMLMVNAFYWPFWLQQDHPTMRQTLYNCCLIVAKRPIYVLTLFIISLLLSAVSIALTLPFAAALAVWLALIGTTAVDDELARVRSAQSHIAMEAGG